jgi:hypothetical protein
LHPDAHHQWQSADAFRAMTTDPVARQRMAECASAATDFDPHLYTVESVHGSG